MNILNKNYLYSRVNLDFHFYNFLSFYKTLRVLINFFYNPDDFFLNYYICIYSNKIRSNIVHEIDICD